MFDLEPEVPSLSKTAYSHNLRIPGLVREETRDGTRFLVVPVIMLQEQVLFCSNCHPKGEFISAEEIASSALAWDNRPVTLSHPGENFNPGNHQRLEVGRVFNTHFSGGKLRGEMWLDTVKLKSTMEGREAEMRFRQGEVTEVSTGYFVERTNRPGTFEGTKFALRQMGIVPDHLAILIGEIGACSVAGGCGAPRLNSNEGDSMDDETKLFAKLLAGLKIVMTLGGMLGTGEQSTDGDAGDGDDGTAANKDGGDSSAAAAGDDGGSGGGKTPDGSGSSMDEKQKKELVKRLLASKKVETFDEKALLAMSDEQLEALATLTGCGCNDGDEGGEGGDDGGSANNAGAGDGGDGGDDGGDAGGSDDGDDGGDADGSSAPAQNISVEDAKFVTALRAASGGSLEGLTALMEAGKVEAERRNSLKAGLVKQLNKDDKVAMSEAVLNGMSLEALEGLDRSLNPLSYAGRGGPRIENRGSEDDTFAPDAPAILLADADGTKSADGDGDGGDS